MLARRVRWDWHDGSRIDVLDEHDRVIHTLDKWQTFVFYLADGNNTIDMIIDSFPRHYKDETKIPAVYARAIIEAAKSLIEEHHWIEPWDEPDDLAREVALPRRDQRRS